MLSVAKRKSLQEANHLLSLGQNDGKNRFCELSNDEL